MNENTSLNKKNASDTESQFYEEMLLIYLANKYIEQENMKIEEEIQNIERVSNAEINIEKIYKKEIKNKKGNKKRIWIYKAGSAVAVILIALIIITTTVPTVRAAAFNFFFRMEKSHTDISNYSDDEVITGNASHSDNNKYIIKFDKEYEVTYLPEGFEIISQTITPAGIDIDYADANNNIIMMSQDVIEASISIDTENAEVYSCDVNGYTAMVSVKKNKIVVIWKVDGYFISISGKGVSEDEMLKVARSIK